MSSNSTEVEEQRSILYVIAKGAKHRIEVRGTPAPVKRMEDAEEEGPRVETPEEQRQNNVLVDALTAAFRECEMQLRTLCEGDEKSVLFQKEKELTAWYAKNPKGLLLLNQRILALGEGRVDITKWQPVQMFDMANPKLKKMIESNMLADYEAMKPATTGVRLLILESVINADEVVAPLRYCVYYCLESQKRKNEEAFDAKYTQMKGEPIPPRTDVSENSIYVISVVWGFVMLQTRVEATAQKSAADAKKESEEQAMAKKKLLYAAHAKYAAKRELTRRRAIDSRAGLIFDFALSHYGPELLARYEKAQPHIPDRMMIRLVVESCGMTLDLDKTNTVCHRDLVQMIDEATEKFKQTEEKFKADRANVELYQSLQDQKTFIEDLRATEQMLGAINPASEVLFNLIEVGQWQDNGVDVQSYVKSVVPYAQLREAKRAVNSIGTNQQATTSTSSSSTASQQATNSTSSQQATNSTAE